MKTKIAKTKTEAGYRVHEIFDSVQFEGANAGRPARFVRFYGCNLNCSFCDTMQRKEPAPLNRTALVDRAVDNLNSDLIVLTGGEPTIQPDFIDFVAALIEATNHRTTIAVETNGTKWKQCFYQLSHMGVHITCSPKEVDKWPQVYRGLRSNIDLVSELKLVWPHHQTSFIDAWLKAVEVLGNEVPVYIQPCYVEDWDPNVTVSYLRQQVQEIQEYLSIAPSRNVRISLQGHKWLGMR